jgi:hypothetical protein
MLLAVPAVVRRSSLPFAYNHEEMTARAPRQAPIGFEGGARDPIEPAGRLHDDCREHA